MVPIPQLDDLEEFNEQLAESCRADLERRCRGQPTTKQGLLEAEQRVLLPLPKQSFEARRVESAKANSLSLVRFDTNDYSVPTAYAHHHVTAVGNIQEVRLIVNDRVVARHPRDWVRENVHYNPLHYLALLERKPGSLDFRTTAGGLAAAGVFWRAASPARRGPTVRRPAGVHPGAAVVGDARVGRIRTHHRAGLGDRRALRRRHSAVGPTRARTTGAMVQPGWPAALQGREIPPPQLDRYAALLLGGAR